MSKVYLAPCGSVEKLTPCDLCGAAPAVDTCPGGYRCGQAGNCLASAIIDRYACEYTGCEHHPAHVPGGPHPDHPQEWSGVPEDCFGIDCVCRASENLGSELPDEYVEVH